MGMDVISRRTDGVRSFRASCWSWRPLHELLTNLCGDLLSEEVLQGMGFNEGFGPDDPAVCQQIARRLRDWLSSSDEAAYFLKDQPQEGTPESAVMELFSQLPGMVVASQDDYYIERELVEEFANFVESSGGFAVW